MTKVFKINVETRQIEETSIETWKDIAPLIGNDCILFDVPLVLDNNDSVYCDDEGLFHENIGGFTTRAYAFPIVGNGIIIGTDYKGESIDVQSTKEDIENKIVFFKKEDLKEYFDSF